MFTYSTEAENIIEAENKFVHIAKEILSSVSPSREDTEAWLDDGYVESPNENSSVCLTWSKVKERPYYAVADLQNDGMHMFSGLNCRTKESVRLELVSYHSADHDEEDLEKMSLEDILSFGDFSLEESDAPFVERES